MTMRRRASSPRIQDILIKVMRQKRRLNSRVIRYVSSFDIILGIIIEGRSLSRKSTKGKDLVLKS